MDDFWSKIVKIIIIAAVIVTGILIFNSIKNKEPKPPQRTFQDQIADDDAKHRAEPKPSLPIKEDNNGQSTQDQAADQKTEEARVPVKIEFKKLNEAENIQAEKIFEMALTTFKTGRLPGMTFKQCADYCKQNIEKYPGTKWDYKARRLMADIPKRYWKQYDIKEEDVITE